MILETLKIDLRYAARTLGKSRLYTAAAVSSLALAIGASIATFAIVDGLVLRPAPWHRPDEVFLLQRSDPKTGRVQSGWSQPRFDDVRHAVAADVPDVANYATRGVTLAAPAGDSGIRADAEFVSTRYVGLTGVSPIRGRAFDLNGADDANPNIVLISARLDRSLFAGQSLGKTLRVNGIGLTVVGIMPTDFFGLSGRSDLWVPLAAAPAVWAQPTALSQYNFGFTIALRIPRSWNTAQRAGVLDNLDRALGTGRPAVAVGGAAGAAPPAGIPSSRITLAPAADALVEPGLKSLLWILLGAACCVLVLACANVASLSVARLTTRSTELAVRSALGATSIRLAASQLIEASIIGVAGAAIGLACAVLAKNVLWAARPTTGGAVARQFAVAIPPSIDERTIAFAVAAALFTILLIGVWPTLEVRRPLDVRRASFGAAGRGADLTSPRAAHLRSALSIIQLALAFVVTTSAVLFVASLRSLTALDHGFSSTSVLTLRLDLPRTRYEAARARNLYTELLRKIALTPGVVSADITNSLPLGVTNGGTAAAIDLSLPNGSGGRGTGLEYHTVGPAFFEALGVATRLRVSSAPSAATDAVPVVITRAAANQFWPGRDPVGHSIHEFLMTELAGQWVRGEVVGVAPDVQYGLPGAPSAPGIYVSYADDPPSRAVLLIKTSVAPERLVGPARAALRSLDPQLVFYDTKTMDARVREVSAATRFGSLVLVTYALVALLIALIGVYSVIAFGVAQRRAEIGIRMALGATSRAILSSILRQGMRMTAGGIVIGAGATLAARRVLASHLFGVTTSDPVYQLLVVAAFAVAGICASVVPALGATRVDPASALRSE